VFFEPQRTQFDLNFRLLGVDVRVHPWFWIMSALLGWNALSNGIAYLLIWIACVFVSILLHEFGHIFMGRLFGARGYVILYGMGGLAVGSTESRRRWQRVLVYFAGPAAGLVLGGLVFVSTLFVLRKDSPPLLEALLLDLLVINILWSLLNLLPIWPLDGGRMSKEFLEWLMPEKGAGVAFGISLVIAGLLAANALCIHFAKHALPVFDHIPILRSLGGIYTAILFGMIAFSNFQMLQLESHRRPWDRQDDSWNR
jgi:stage IV sporulation protein FB